MTTITQQSEPNTKIIEIVETVTLCFGKIFLASVAGGAFWFFAPSFLTNGWRIFASSFIFIFILKMLTSEHLQKSFQYFTKICQAIGEVVLLLMSIAFVVLIFSVFGSHSLIAVWLVFAFVLVFGFAKLSHEYLLPLLNGCNCVQELKKKESVKKLVKSLKFITSIPSEKLYKFLPDKLYYLFLLRVPIISGLLLFLFPLISQFLATKFLQNLFIIESSFELSLVMVFSTPHSAAQSRKKDSSFVLLFSPQVYC
jgi:hypothetical protein